MMSESTNARVYQFTMRMVRELRTLLGHTTLQGMLEYIVKEEYESAAITQLREMQNTQQRLLREAGGK